MHFASFSVTLLALSTLSSAGPIHKHPSQVRHILDPQRRWVVNELVSTLDGPHKRHEQSTSTISTIDPFAVPTRQGTQDGKVGAVGVGGSSTSLLSLLTQSLSTTTATATAVAVAVAATDESAPATGTNIQAAQDVGESTTTVRVQSTILETVFVTAAESQLATVSAAVAPAPATVTVVLVTTEGSTSFSILDSTSIPLTASDVVAAAGQTITSQDSAASSTVTGSALPSETLTIRPGPGSIPASEARPATLSTAAPPPDAETATASSPPTTAAPEATASSSSSDAESLAVVPITPDPVQQNQNPIESLLTVTETETTTVTNSA